MTLIAIYNPASGDGTSESFFNEHVLPLLSSHGKSPYKQFATEYPAHAGEMLVKFLGSAEQDTDVTIVLCSGDGTLHDIVNYLSDHKTGARLGEQVGASFSQLRFALVPCGTANALFASLFPPKGEFNPSDIAHRLQSVYSYLRSSQAIPLNLIKTELYTHTQSPSRAIGSVVVVSTSLHASILYDSERLRQEIPGIERFKVAARNNSTQWYNSSVKLLPLPSGASIQLYDPKTKSFVNHPDSNEDNRVVNLSGPFIYFLSTVNVDRLEPQFQIAPLTKISPPTEASCDVIIIRPLRDPSILEDSPIARESFVAKLWSVLGGAYEEGKHVDLRYTTNGEITLDGEQSTVVEYLRCGGWEWIPDNIDGNSAAHLLCTDGAISHIDKGGRAVCSVTKLNKITVCA